MQILFARPSTAVAVEVSGHVNIYTARIYLFTHFLLFLGSKVF
jgi:hypothetical protein